MCTHYQYTCSHLCVCVDCISTSQGHCRELQGRKKKLTRLVDNDVSPAGNITLKGGCAKTRALQVEITSNVDNGLFRCSINLCKKCEEIKQGKDNANPHEDFQQPKKTNKPEGQ